MNKFLFLIIICVLFFNCFSGLTRRQKRVLNSYISQSNLAEFNQTIHKTIDISEADKLQMINLADKIAESRYKALIQKQQEIKDSPIFISDKKSAAVSAFTGITAVGAVGSLSGMAMVASSPITLGGRMSDFFAIFNSYLWRSINYCIYASCNYWWNWAWSL